MFEQENLYKNYSDKGTGTKSIIKRMHQRENWLSKFNKNGSCKQLLIDANIIETENE